MHTRPTPTRAPVDLPHAPGTSLKPCRRASHPRPTPTPLTPSSLPPLAPPTPALSETSSSSSAPSTDSSLRKRPRCLRSLALAAVIEDMADVNAESSRVAPAGAELPSPDEILAAAAVPPAVLVCAAVYAGRLDAGRLPVTWANLSGILVGCLCAGAEVLEREGVLEKIGAGVGAGAVAECAQIVRAALGRDGVGISVGTFREFEEMLDDVIPEECL